MSELQQARAKVKQLRSELRAAKSVVRKLTETTPRKMVSDEVERVLKLKPDGRTPDEIANVLGNPSVNSIRTTLYNLTNEGRATKCGVNLWKSTP